MYNVKGYAFHHKENGEIIKIDINEVSDNFIAKDYEQARQFFVGIPYYMFLLSPIKEKDKEE